MVTLILLDIWFIITLLITCIIANLVLLKTERMKKNGKVALSLLSISIAALIATNLYTHYSQEILPAMNHTLFKAAYVSGILIIIQKRDLKVLTKVLNSMELGFFDQLNYVLPRVVLRGAESLHNAVEVNFFDQLNYIPKRVIINSSERLRKLQTGNLNLNMLTVLSFFLFCLTLLVLQNLH